MLIFSNTTVESSTNIHRTNIRANRVILFMFSQAIKAIVNTENKVRGILIAVFKAFLKPRAKLKTITTMIILWSKFQSSISVAIFAFFHSSWIISIFRFFGSSFLIFSNSCLIPSVTKTEFDQIFFQKPKNTASFQLDLDNLSILFIQYLTSAISSKYILSFITVFLISSKELVKEADESLYKAKNTGKNQVVQKAILSNNLKTEI